MHESLIRIWMSKPTSLRNSYPVTAMPHGRHCSCNFDKSIIVDVLGAEGAEFGTVACSLFLQLSNQVSICGAVPYRACDVPSERSEFKHPDVTIVLTHLSYHQAGLCEADMVKALSALKELRSPSRQEVIYRCGVSLFCIIATYLVALLRVYALRVLVDAC